MNVDYFTLPLTNRRPIHRQVGYVTCDNATNNNTMVTEFSSHINNDTDKPYDPKKHRLQWVDHCLTRLTLLMSNIAVVWFTSLTLQLRLCLWHTASPNIMIQHLQKTLWWLHMMALGVMKWVWFVQLQLRWVIHLTTLDLNCQCCQTQEQSSAQHKELFWRVQLRSDDGHIPRNPPLQLVLDMKVRWSSSFVMLCHAVDLLEASSFINWFLLSWFHLFGRRLFTLFRCLEFKNEILRNAAKSKT